MTDEAAPIQHFYGIWRDGAVVRSFVVTDRSKIPEDALEIRVTTAGEQIAATVAAKLLREYRPPPPETEPVPTGARPTDLLVPGEFVIYEDGLGGKHCAILLEPSANRYHWLAVFLTSQTHWTTAPVLRASQEDLASGSFVSSRPTYLAPVIRPAQFFRSWHSGTERCVSATRVTELLKFFRPYFESRLP